MGILCSRQARTSVPSSLAAINKGKYASLDQDAADDLQPSQLTVAGGVKCTRSTSGLSPENQHATLVWLFPLITPLYSIFLLNSVLV